VVIFIINNLPKDPKSNLKKIKTLANSLYHLKTILQIFRKSVCVNLLGVVSFGEKIFSGFG